MSAIALSIITAVRLRKIKKGTQTQQNANREYVQRRRMKHEQLLRYKKITNPKFKNAKTGKNGTEQHLEQKDEMKDL